MRPAIIGLIAGLLPLGVYAHPGWHGGAQGQTPATAPVTAVATVAADSEATKAPKTEEQVAANDPRAPGKKTPLCASPEVSAWNPAATGKGVICTPTMWASADSVRKSG